MTRILVIDNFDSFTNNIVQYVHEVSGVKPIVVDNKIKYDDLPLDDVVGIIISPGPGRPSNAGDFGVCREVIERGERPILGVCLGHQGIAEVFGGKVAHSPEPVHGMSEEVVHDGESIFAGLPNPMRVVRYHSLVVTDVPNDLKVTARSADGLVMALQHESLPIWGVQFHPESIDTEYGHELLSNFVKLANDYMDISDVVAAFQRVGGVVRSSPRISEIGWPADVVEEFRCAQDRGARFWLDCEGSEHPDARYSVLDDGGVGVLISYELKHRRLTLDGPNGRQDVTGDVFELVNDLLSVLGKGEREFYNPFSVGLVGYFGYELKALTGGILAFESDVPDAVFLWPSSFVVLDHNERRAWRHQVIPDNELSTGMASERIRGTTQPSYVPGAVPDSFLELRDAHEDYVKKIEEAQRYIRDGESYEVCLTNQVSTTAPKDPFETYEHMRSISPVPYGAFLDFPEVSILSSSPETFIRIGLDGTVTTKPIKGTRPRGTDSECDEQLKHELATSAKDRAENLMIVDLVRHDLNAVCVPGSVTVPSKFEIQTFRSVHQLVSTVVGIRAEQRTSVDVIRSCFPPGSMTGAPKVRTMEIIDALEDAPRGPYSGALGWLDASGASTLSVVIRTIVIKKEDARFGIGGAITTLSDAEEEFEETMVKASVPWHVLTSSSLANTGLLSI